MSEQDKLNRSIILEIIEIDKQLAQIPAAKMAVVESQSYEAAIILRDQEQALIKAKEQLIAALPHCEATATHYSFKHVSKEDALRQLISVSIELNEVKAESRNCRCINKKKDLVACCEKLSKQVEDLTAIVLKSNNENI